MRFAGRSGANLFVSQRRRSLLLFPLKYASRNNGTENPALGVCRNPPCFQLSWRRAKWLGG
jgi:hypothetical protein